MKRNRAWKGEKVASTLPPKGKWGVWVAPGLFVTSPNDFPPRRFYRMMQRLLLGWRWEQAK